MANTKDSKEIEALHNEWCRANGYPVRWIKRQAGRPKLQASSSKLQAASDMLNAVNSERFVESAKPTERQAASFKPRAASIKLQAASDKLPNIFSFIKIRETRGEGLY